jgi:hypothetical protein
MRLSDLRWKWLIPGFFATYLVLGLWLVPDYGMSWDEAVQRRYGLVALDYYIEKLGIPWEKSFPEASLETAGGRQYSVLFPTFGALMERLLHLEDDFRGRYLMRHYAVFILFWIGAIYFYRLLYERLHNPWLALLGVVMLIASPRIFAHSFFNPKDIVLLSFYVIASFTMVRFLYDPSPKRAAAHGLATALVVNARILGIIIPVLTVFGVLLLLFRKQADKTSQRQLKVSFPLFLLIGGVLTVLLFPFLWSAPVANAKASFNMMANFPWGSSVLYFGQLIEGAAIPWHYPFVWIGITTPIAYLFAFFIGLGLVVPPVLGAIANMRFWENKAQLIDCFTLALLFGPLAAILVKSSTLYNGWRQLFFIYPILLLIAMVGIQFLLKHPNKNLQWLMIAGLAYSGGQTIQFMIKNHPHQQVYFNALAGDRVADRFDMDYWGVAYKQALEAIPLRDTSAVIQINCNNYPCEDNFRFLPEATRQRLKLRYGPEVADYVLSNFRRAEAFRKYKDGAYPFQNPAFFIEVEGEPIIGVYQPNRPAPPQTEGEPPDRN